MSERKGRIMVLYNKQSGACAYTGIQMTLELGHPHTATIEHPIPKSRIGGKAFKEFNQVAVCHWVNQLKGDMPLSDFIGILVHKGYEKG